MELRRIKYKLEFVNKGKEFEIPKMTVRLHELAMKTISDRFKKIPEAEFNSKLPVYVVATVLNKADGSKSIEDYVDCVKDMHPDDLIELFGEVWSSGRKTKKNFRADI